MTTEADDKEVIVPDVPVQTEVDVTPVLSDDEQAAVDKGWQTKEDWVKAGKSEDEWKPAKVFNEIGGLKDKLAEREREAKKLNKVVQLMKEHHIGVREAAVKQAIETLRKERRTALEAQDFATAEKLRDDMDDLNAKASQGVRLPREIETQIAEVEKQPDPSFTEFRQRNPWYKPDSGKDDEISRRADALGFSYSQQNPDWSFEKVIKQVEKDVKRLFPDKFETPNNPVNEPGTRGAPAPRSGTKSSLSAEEKAVARSFEMTDEEYAKEAKSYRGPQW